MKYNIYVQDQESVELFTRIGEIIVYSDNPDTEATFALQAAKEMHPKYGSLIVVSPSNA